MSVNNARMHSYIKTSRLSLHKEKGSFNIKNVKRVCCKQEGGGREGFRNETLSFIFSKAVLYQPCSCNGNEL